MARKQKDALAMELLKADHRKVEGLFEDYEGQKEAEDEQRSETAAMICRELTVHAQIEEEIFYPWLRENLDEEEMDMVEEAQVEHASAKDLIAQIEAGGEVDDAFDAKVKVLGEYIRHHVEEEEQEIFEAVADMAEELDALGQELAARKAELAEQMGLMEEEQPAPSKGRGRNAASASR
jgi:hemerythrin superfamily protein